MCLPVFLSMVLIVRNQESELAGLVESVTEQLSSMVADHELVIIDNGSDDQTVSVLKQLTGESGTPNLQVYSLTKEVDLDIACCVGLEHAIGDFVAFVDLSYDDISFLPTMLNQSVTGADVVFASNEHGSPETVTYRAAAAVFNALYRVLGGVHLAKDAPRYRVLSRRVVNFILRHPQPAITYRHLPATGGFARVNLKYSSAPGGRGKTRRLAEGIDRGTRLLVSTTRLPMRLVTSLALFGAGANVLYSGYVLIIGLTRTDVTPGWVSLSLQQSGMFFLISLVLLILGEYILQMASLANEGPRYHIAQEFTSARLTRREKLNIEQPTTERLERPAVADMSSRG